MEERILKSHKISLFNRSSGIISGVKEVISFDPNEIILDTEQGMLMIQGEELHVTKLTVEKGEVEIEGLVYSMVYSDDGYMKGEKGYSPMALFCLGDFGSGSSYRLSFYYSVAQASEESK